MKQILRSLPWRALALTGLGVWVGVLTLVLSAAACLDLDAGELFFSYFTANPLVALVNCLVPVGLVWLGWFLTQRGWAAYLLGCLPCLAVGLVNSFKISLRSDPLLFSDLMLAAEAGDIMGGGYVLEFTPAILASLACGVLGLVFAALCIPRGTLKVPERVFAALSGAAVLAISMPAFFLNEGFEEKMVNEGLIDPWSDTERYVSRGAVSSFLNSAGELFESAPEGFDRNHARALLSAFPGADIPEEKKVSVMAVMLEAFVDLTDYPVLAGQPMVTELYAPWHALEEQSVHGDLLTNIFAGGTVDSEWGFLTGYSSHGDFTGVTDSFVWYFRDQGYRTFGSHPGNGWFYDRENINQYLGFEEYWFSENFYGQHVDPTAALWNSDYILFPTLTQQIKQRAKDGPCFSFSVSIQNHGPYSADPSTALPYVDCLDPESNNIFNNYLRGIGDTIGHVAAMVEELEGMEEPVVLVLFGDHKPWGGNSNSAYEAAGVSFDMTTTEGFYNYWSTPYLIWANSAAKQVLGSGFTGDGGDLSPCFLMAELFDQCGWTGDSFLQLQRMVRDVTPLLHGSGLFWHNGALTDGLSTQDTEIVYGYRNAEYFREHYVR